jgi:hypothetical protein
MKFRNVFGLLLVAILCSSFAFGALDDAELYYSYDNADLTGNDPEDISGNGRDGVNNGATTGVAGKINQAFDFDGTNDDVTVPALFSGQTAFTFCTWSEADSISVDYTVWDYRGNGILTYMILNDGAVNNEIEVYIRDTITGANRIETTAYTVTDNLHLCYTVDGTAKEMELFVNGASVITESWAGSLTDLGQSNDKIGEDSAGGDNYDGVLDETAIYYRVLSSTEISELFNENNGKNPYSSPQTLKVTSQTYDGVNMTDFNISIEYSGGTFTNGTSSGFAGTSVLNNESVNITVTSNTATSNFSQTFTDWTGDLVFNYSSIKISAQNARTNVSIADFTAETTGGLIDNSSSSIVRFFTNTGTFNTTVSATGFVPSNENIVVSLNGLTAQTFSLYASNSILVNIYNATSGSKLTQTVNLFVENATDTVRSNTTSTGEFFYYELYPDTYIITATSTGFQNAEYEVTVGNNTFQTLNIFMPEETDTSEVFTVKDENSGDVIESATVSVQRFINGSFVLVNSLSTDITGRVQFSYVEGDRYRFIVSKTGYETKTFELNPIIFSSYNIWLTPQIDVEPTDNDLLTITIEPSQYQNNANNSLIVVFSSPDGSLELYGFSATWNATTFTNQGTNAYGEALNQTIQILDAELGDRVYLEYYYMLSGGDLKTFSGYYTISGLNATAGTFLNVGDDYGLGLFERVLIVTLITLAIAGAGFLFSGITGSGLLAMLILGFFIQLGFLTPWILVPPMIFIFLLVAWRFS